MVILHPMNDSRIWVIYTKFVTIHVYTCCYTVSQGHDNFDILRPELMNSLCWLGEGRELGTVEVNLTSREPFQREKSHDTEVEIHVCGVDVAACMLSMVYVCLFVRQFARALRRRNSGGVKLVMCSCHLTRIIENVRQQFYACAVTLPSFLAVQSWWMSVQYYIPSNLSFYRCAL